MDTPQVIAMFQAHAPDSLEDARPDPGLETQVAGAPGTVLPKDHLPLTAGAENVENTIEHDAVWNSGPTIAPQRLSGGRTRSISSHRSSGISRSPFRFLGLLRIALCSMTLRWFCRPSPTKNVKGFGTHS